MTRREIHRQARCADPANRTAAAMTTALRVPSLLALVGVLAMALL
jgi:hypothetical protein